MNVKELVKKVRLELGEAVRLDNEQHEITSRACLGHAENLIQKYLGQFEHYSGKERTN